MKKYFIALIIGIFLSMVIAIFFIIKMERYLYDNEVSKIDESHANIVEKIDNFSQEKHTFIKMIADYAPVKALLTQNDRAALQLTQNLFYNLAKSSTMIMQIRILDSDGKERVRVDRLINEDIVQVTDKDLQDKANRDYFLEFSKLKEDVIGTSSLDLNIEHDRVEIPWRPTLRMGIPIFENNNRIGIVVINYCMKHWLEDIQKVTLNNFYLVDSKGYFIIHPDDKWKWSRYQNPSKTMYDYFPSLKNFDMNSTNLQIAENLFAVKVKFFHNQEMLVINEPKIPISKVLFNNGMKVISVITIMFILILIPVVLLILKFIKNLKDEKETIEESQIYISKIFNNTFDAMFVINRVGIIQKVNLSAQTLFAYEERELLGQNINMLVPEPDHSNHDAYLKAYKDDGHSVVIGAERSLFGLSKDGTLIPITLSVSKMELDNEVLFIGSIRDHTKLQIAIDKQRAQEAMLLEQSKLAAMGEMLSAIAHQWRQPLNSVGLIVQDVVSAQKHGELNTQYLEESKDAIMDQLHLMSDTIDEFRNFFAKTNVKKHFSVVDAISELRNLYWAQFKASNISFEVLYEKDKSYEIESLPSELKQVLLNIVANAKDAISCMANPNALERTISIYISETDKEIIIAVGDYAGGMEESVMKRIFEPYFTTKEMGTGIGLFIVKTLLEKHLEGTIECASRTSVADEKEYKGTTFSIKIPKNL